MHPRSSERRIVRGTSVMPFIHMLDANRKPTGLVHLNLGPKGNREAKNCPFCAREKLWQLSTKLCDAKVARGTCDATICDYHTTHVDGEDLDYCPKHKDQAPR